MLYFLPGINAHPTPEQIEEYGISYAIERGYSVSQITGPENQRGVLVCDPAFDPKFYPDKQTWRQIPGAKAWVGVNNGEKVDPEKLRRKGGLPGSLVEMADGSTWEIPVARSWVNDGNGISYRNRLPRLAQVNERGKWVLDAVLPDYQELWQLSFDYAASRWTSLEHVDAKYKFELVSEYLDASCVVLSLNYRISAVEASLLKLLTEEVAASILDATVEAKTLDDWMKKKAKDGESEASDTPNS